MAKHITHGPQQTAELARRLGGKLRAGDILALFGGLGAGKTTFCRGLAVGLHCKGHVSSPTFDLVHLYEGDIPLAHFDAYRITSTDDLEAAGFYDYHEQGAVIAVEWSENILPLIEGPYISVSITPLGGDVREISIQGVDGF